MKDTERFVFWKIRRNFKQKSDYSQAENIVFKSISAKYFEKIFFANSLSSILVVYFQIKYSAILHCLREFTLKHMKDIKGL